MLQCERQIVMDQSARYILSTSITQTKLPIGTHRAVCNFEGDLVDTVHDESKVWRWLNFPNSEVFHLITLWKVDEYRIHMNFCTQSILFVDKTNSNEMGLYCVWLQIYCLTLPLVFPFFSSDPSYAIDINNHIQTHERLFENVDVSELALIWFICVMCVQHNKRHTLAEWSVVATSKSGKIYNNSV